MKEINCEICHRTFKSLGGLKTHYSMLKDHTSYMSWLHYKDKYVLKIDKSKDKKFTQCKICKEYYKSIGDHIARSPLHKNISHKLYYDSYLKTINDGNCYHDKCNNETNFIDISKGYRKFCSSKCCNSDPKNIEERVDTFKQTITKNPEIVKNAMITRKKVYDDNPDKKEKEIKKMVISMRDKYNKLADLEMKIPYFLYLIKHQTKSIIKIGRSEEPEIRLERIIKDFGSSEIVYILQRPFNQICKLETFLHNYFNTYCKVQPSGGGRTEWFDECILEEAMEIINNV